MWPSSKVLLIVRDPLGHCDIVLQQPMKDIPRLYGMQSTALTSHAPCREQQSPHMHLAEHSNNLTCTLHSTAWSHMHLDLTMDDRLTCWPGHSTLGAKLWSMVWSNYFIHVVALKWQPMASTLFLGHKRRCGITGCCGHPPVQEKHTISLTPPQVNNICNRLHLGHAWSKLWQYYWRSLHTALSWYISHF